MCKVLLVLVAFAVYGEASAQKERVYVGLDKYNCLVGDTVWCKGYVLQGDYLSHLSTTLYLQLYDEHGILVMHRMFPVFSGYMTGQFTVPDSFATGTYYLSAFTRQQFNYDSTSLFTVPLIIFNKDKQQVAVHKKRVRQQIPAVQGDAKDLHCITTFHHDSLCLYLRLDSVAGERHFLCQKILSMDSAVSVAFTLSPSHEDTYVLFQVDSTKDREEVFIYEDSVLIGRQSVSVRARDIPVELFVDTLDLEKEGYNAWRVRLADSTILYPLISVSDADRVGEAPLNIDCLNESYADDYSRKERQLDTAFLSFSGRATKASGKKFKDLLYRQISVAGYKDSVYLFSNAINLDSVGNFNLSPLFFFGEVALNYQLNHSYANDNKDVLLHLVKPRMLKLDSSIFAQQWQDGDVLGAVDTLMHGEELVKYEHSKIRTLAPVVVKRWKRPGDELNKMYATGPFAESAMYEYDLRTYTSEYNRDIFSYIQALGINITYDPVSDRIYDLTGHSIHFFIDQMECDYIMLKTLDFDRIAYVKILESDMLSTKSPAASLIASGGQPGGAPPLKMPEWKTAYNLCIYTRKGKDFRTMRGGMNKVMIQGYDEMSGSFMHDRATLYWNVWGTGREQYLRFNNTNGAKRFRVRIEGVTRKGRVVCMEKIIG